MLDVVTRRPHERRLSSTASSPARRTIRHRPDDDGGAGKAMPCGYAEPLIIKLIRTNNKAPSAIEEQIIAATIENAAAIHVWGLMATRQLSDKKAARTVAVLAAREFAHRQYPGLDLDIMPDD